ncbi:prepilin peptidase [Patescibacteria group bacterium]|nr:prepilin peptidase [Patescibacteria group bacterium]
MNFLFYFFVFIFGLAVGSFLNVIILRLNSRQRRGSPKAAGQVCRLETGEPETEDSPPFKRRTVLRGRSHCPRCGAILRWYDLVPVLSFFVLRGRCRYCSQPISWQYPLVEIATGALFLLTVGGITNQELGIKNNLAFGFWNLFEIWHLDFGILITICYMLFVICSLIVIFTYDLRHYIIPDKIIFPAIIVVVLFRVFEILNFGHWNLFGIWDLPPLASLAPGGGFGIWRPFLFYFLSAVGAAVFFLAIVLVTKGKGMGVGDVKLAFLMGLILGWPNILVALLLAFSSGALVGLGLIVAKQKTLKSQIPFGPFLISGTLVSFFFGSAIINWYFSFLL